MLDRRRKHHPRRRPRFGLADLDVLARSAACVDALQPVEPDDLQCFVFGIGIERARRRRALADNLDHIALGQPKRCHGGARQPGKATAAVFGPGIGDLQPQAVGLGVGHAQFS